MLIKEISGYKIEPVVIEEKVKITKRKKEETMNNALCNFLKQKS